MKKVLLTAAALSFAAPTAFAGSAEVFTAPAEPEVEVSQEAPAGGSNAAIIVPIIAIIAIAAGIAASD